MIGNKIDNILYRFILIEKHDIQEIVYLQEVIAYNARFSLLPELQLTTLPLLPGNIIVMFYQSLVSIVLVRNNGLLQ